MNTKVGKKGNLGGKIDPNFVNRIRASKFSNMKLGPEIKIRSRLVEDYLDSNKPNKPNKYSKIANMVKRFGTVMALASTIAFNTSLKNKNVNYNPSIKSNKPAIVKVVDNAKRNFPSSIGKAYATEKKSKDPRLKKRDEVFKYLESNGVEKTLEKYPEVKTYLTAVEEQGYEVAYELSTFSTPETSSLDKLKLVDNEEEFKSLFMFDAERPAYPISYFLDTAKDALEEGGFRSGLSKIAPLAANGDQWVFTEKTEITYALVAINKKDLDRITRNELPEYIDNRLINPIYSLRYFNEIKNSGLKHDQAWVFSTSLPDGSKGLVYVSSVESWVLKIYDDRVEKLSWSFSPFMLAGIKGDWEVIPRKIDDYNYELTITSKDLADKVRNGEEIPENSRVIVMKVNYKERSEYGNEEYPINRNFTIYTYGTDPKKAIRWPFDYLVKEYITVLDKNPDIAARDDLPYILAVVSAKFRRDEEAIEYWGNQLLAFKLNRNPNEITKKAIEDITELFTNQFRDWFDLY